MNKMLNLIKLTNPSFGIMSGLLSILRGSWGLNECLGAEFLYEKQLFCEVGVIQREQDKSLSGQKFK